jgi:regulatory protein
MKITDIKQQVKRQDRYSIYVDGKYVFSFSENELLNLGLRVGQEFGDGELEELKKTAIEDKAYMRSLDLIMRRQRSEWEVRDYLKRKDYEQDIIEKIVKRLAGMGYVDDKKFAEAWVSNRRLLKATSKRKLTMELRQKRVADEITKEVLEEDKTDERQVLKDLIAKKRNQTRYQDEQKLIAYLLRQGFNYEDVKSALHDD